MTCSLARIKEFLGNWEVVKGNFIFGGFFFLFSFSFLWPNVRKLNLQYLQSPAMHLAFIAN